MSRLPLRRRTRRRTTDFWHGEWRELRDPDGPPTGKQLLKLNERGMLELVNPSRAKPLTKAECAAALDEVTP